MSKYIVIYKDYGNDEVLSYEKFDYLSEAKKFVEEDNSIAEDQYFIVLGEIKE